MGRGILALLTLFAMGIALGATGCAHYLFPPKTLAVESFGGGALVLTASSGFTAAIDPSLVVLEHHRRLRGRLDAIVLTGNIKGFFHVDATELLHRRFPKARLFGNAEVQSILDRRNLYVERLLAGQKYKIGGCELAGVRTSIAMRDRIVDTIGVALSFGEKSIYYTGLTEFFDPASLPYKGVDLLIVSTALQGEIMRPDQAGNFAMTIRPKLLFPLDFSPGKEALPLFFQALKQSSIKMVQPQLGVPIVF